MFGKKSKIELKALPITRKANLSGNNNVGASFSETVSCIYFFVWDSADIGKLEFDAKAYRSVRTDCNPYMTKEFSFLVEVVGSDWPSEMENWVYMDSRNAPWFLEAKKRAKHYVVAGNDIYHEFLADEFSEEYLSENSEEYQNALHVLGGKP